MCHTHSITTTLKNKAYIILALIGMHSLSGCAVHYKDIRDDVPKTTNYSVQGTVKYRIKELPVFTSGGLDEIDQVFRSSNAFKDTERYYEKDIPSKGIFILVDPQYHTPTIPAIAFGYLSLSTLTILPAWSNHDGFDVFYKIYIDGELKKTLRYESRRFLAVWLGLIPFVWANLLTTGEDDAFRAMTYEFLEDAEPYFK